MMPLNAAAAEAEDHALAAAKPTKQHHQRYPNTRLAAQALYQSMLRDPVTAYIALGANLGDAATTLRQATTHIAQLANTQMVRSSHFYNTAPIDSSGPDYTNAVIEVKTALCALDLLKQLQILEHRAGRQRPFPNAPRTLDLDILLYGSASMDRTNTGRMSM